MPDPRVRLYNRLPEIYRIRDEEQQPPGQLRHFLALVEDVFGEIHKNIEALYHDLFIETCDDWVIPYIGDLLGVSHLKGDAWTLRADVADTIALRRRKGTLASIERLTYNLTQWGIHCAELRENLVWNQHLNHQRPDEGGIPPYSLPSVTHFTPIRGGTVTLRDPAMLSLLNTPFDPFAHLADVKPPDCGNIRYNLPNLAIFLWRLEDYRVAVSKPVHRGTQAIGASPELDARVVRFDVHPLGDPVRLFNINQFKPVREPPVITQLDETPNPIPAARLTQGSAAGKPEKYLSVDTYDPDDSAVATRNIADVGLQLHLPESAFAGESWPNEHPGVWKIRGADLCDWESGLPAAIQDREIVIDPTIGRMVIGVSSPEEASALRDDLLVTYTYGAVGPVGAHPVDRMKTPEPWDDDDVVEVSGFGIPPPLLTEALATLLENHDSPVLVEIRDSLTHVLDLSCFTSEDGAPTIRLNQPLLIRAASGQRPIILLKQPLRFRAADPAEADKLIVRLEGLYITRFESETPGDSFPSEEALIARAAINKLEIINCTLHPGGQRQLDSTAESLRAPIQPSLKLHEPYGFADDAEELAFDQTPEVVIQRSITGPLLVDTGYRLSLTHSIIEAGAGVGDEANDRFCVTGATTDPPNGWGPPLKVEGVTFFGRVRVERISGSAKGGIWVHQLEVFDHQAGCIKFSYFSGDEENGLPQNHACVKGTEALLHFTSEVFGEPGYGQLAHTTDFRIRERGPGEDAMGAFGFLLEAHKWRNLQIRYREFMPLGIRPLLIPVT